MYIYIILYTYILYIKLVYIYTYKLPFERNTKDSEYDSVRKENSILHTKKHVERGYSI